MNTDHFVVGVTAVIAVAILLLRLYLESHDDHED